MGASERHTIQRRDETIRQLRAQIENLKREWEQEAKRLLAEAAPDRAAMVEVARKALWGPMRVYEEWELTQQGDWQDAVAIRIVDDYLAEQDGNP